MTEQTIPADQARRARQWARDTLDDVENGANVSAYARDAARTLIAMMPRPTLADMTPEERAACKWMQCDVTGFRGRWVLATPYDEDGDAGLISACGEMAWSSPAQITPRPDLPRLEWPGNEKPAPAPALPEGWRVAGHKINGRVIVTNPTPNRDGRVYYVIPADDPLGFDWLFCHPDELTYIDQGDDTSDAAPPNTLAVGSTWDDADALTRTCFGSGRDQIAMIDKNGDVGVWDAGLQSWCAYAASADFAPYTILHAGKKADQ